MKTITQGQQEFIYTLIRERVDGNPSAMEAFGTWAQTPFGKTLDMQQWVSQRNMAEAKLVIGWLQSQPKLPGVTPQPQATSDGPLSDKQRAYIWRLLKAMNYSTYQVFTLRHKDPDIPHLYNGVDHDTSVWDWINGLTVVEASNVVQYLQEASGL